MNEFSHITVMQGESIDALNIKDDGVYIDGTAGGGGHSELIAKKLGSGKLLAIDIDPKAVAAASERLAKYPNARVVLGSYSDVDIIAKENGIDEIDGFLIDVGVSSFQLDAAGRGFSYHVDEPLDMRMGQTDTTAKDVINGYSEKELANLFFKYGDEKYSFKIASAIVRERNKAEIETTKQLSEIISDAVPAAYRRKGHPSRKVFQAVRIEVNQEFRNIEQGIERAFELLKSGGRLCVISFHSKEDAVVKNAFKQYFKGCECPSDFPLCVCGKKPRAKKVSKRGIEPTEKEVLENRRSRSARLRVIEKI